MRRPIARDINQRKRAVGSQVSSWVNFTPASLSPDLWLDAADSATITESGGAVSQWDDKSGNGRNFTQATGVSQPATGTRTQNGLNVLDFDQDFMSGGDILDLRTNGLTMIGVAAMDVIAGGTANTRGVWGKGIAASQAGRYSFFASSAGFNTFTEDTSVKLVTNDPGVGNQFNTYIWTQRIIRNSTIQLFRNNFIVASTAVTGTTDYNNGNLFYIGIYQDGTGTAPLSGAGINGMIAELLVFNRDLTNNELNMVSAYLNDKWGVF